MAAENDPTGWPWVIGPAQRERPLIPVVSEAHAPPRLLTPGGALLLCLLISLGLWGVVWFIVEALL
jgi:hypothetical protein